MIEKDYHPFGISVKYICDNCGLPSKIYHEYHAYPSSQLIKESLADWIVKENKTLCSKCITNNKIMKTVFVAFYKKTTESFDSEKYVFNVDGDVNVGDVLYANYYNNKFKVVDVLDDCFKYTNKSTGDLKQEITSTKDTKIKTIVVNDDHTDDVVYARRKL